MVSEEVGGLGGQVIARLARNVEAALEPFGLSLAQYRLLGLLADGEHASAQLASKMAVSPPSVSAVVEVLVGRGLVVRRRDVADRRRHPLTLTADGEAVLARANEAVDVELEDILQHVDSRRAAAARSSWAHWRRALDGRSEIRWRAAPPRIQLNDDQSEIG